MINRLMILYSNPFRHLLVIMNNRTYLTRLAIKTCKPYGCNYLNGQDRIEA